MRRLIAAILLLLALCDVPLWVRGYTAGDTLIYRWVNPNSLRFTQIWTEFGGLRIMFGSEWYPPSQHPQFYSWEPGLHHGTFGGPRYPTEIWETGKQWGGIGFYYYWLGEASPPAPDEIRLHRTHRAVTFPHAFLILLLLLYPTRFAWTTIRSRHRRKHNLCLNCGYDLRGASDRCPECGAMPGAR